MSKVVADEIGCWIWTGSRGRDGYGRMYYGPGEWRLAHRVVYEGMRGEIPSGMVLDHLCRRPACVNPDHLEVVTNRENVIRGHNESMEAFRAGTCRSGHPKSESYRKRDGSVAYCRICRNERRRRAA